MATFQQGTPVPAASVKSDDARTKTPNPVPFSTQSADYAARATIGPELRDMLILYGRTADLWAHTCDAFTRMYSSSLGEDAAEAAATEIAEKLAPFMDEIRQRAQDQIFEAIYSPDDESGIL